MKSNLLRNRLKLFFLFLITTVVAFSKNPAIPIGFFLILILLLYLSRSKQKIISRIRPLLIIGLFVISFQLIFNTPVSPSIRIIEGFTAAIKIITLSLFVFLYTSTASPSEIIASFSFLPKKLLLMFAITFNMIPTILSESEKIVIVQRCRGYQSRSFNIFGNILPVIIPLLHRTLRRAEQLSLVLLSRGYDEK